ncbi:unnamed protein product [Knipowitschia caucasica]
MSRKSKSFVWQHYVKTDDKTVECNLCKQKFTYHSSTTNMAYHLKQAHPQVIQPQDAATGTQTKLDMAYPLSAKKKGEITKSIVNFIAKDMRPLNIVEGDGFREMIKTLEPRFTIPARKTLKGEITVRFEEVKEKIHQSLQRARAVSFTTDLWSSLRMEA